MSTLVTEFALPLDLEPPTLREFQRQHDAASYTLLDVRQRDEYEQTRLPGSTLIPLPELAARIGEIDATRPVVVYCRTGHRSRAAAQWLLRRGFAEVYDLRGGIRAWDGQEAVGPADWGLEFVPVAATAGAAAAVALVLEEGLAGLYGDIAAQISDRETEILFGRLAKVEEKHVHKVRRLLEHHRTDPTEGQALVAAVAGKVEGGFSREALLGQAFRLLGEPDHLLQLAMMIETQAWDLYLRYGDRASRPETRALWFELARDEQQHLSWLADRLAEVLRGELHQG